jgi:hypothetical protein
MTSDQEKTTEATLKKCRVRRCNWPRFLTFLNNNNNNNNNKATANLKCTKNSGQVVYETLENIAPYTELIVMTSSLQQQQQYYVDDTTLMTKSIAAFMTGTLIYANLR